MNAIIFHGTSASPQHFWYPWLAKSLRAAGYETWLPALPDADKPCLENWLQFALNNGSYNAGTVLIGHSSGAALILSVLEKNISAVQKVVLVAGFARPLTEDHENPILQDRYDWQKIRDNFRSLIIINSDNDPWGCDDKAGRFIFDQLGGTQIILHGEGHMGSNSFNQPYKEFPLLLELVVSESI